uniref:Uncharacterized protein n=1 Tax=Phage sp. ctesc4 TaxID=2828008 RepID=A0A8S5TEA5_9VIRU|nr:MAG TPA: hypothetical protein [Phage sp. ctesc4]
MLFDIACHRPSFCRQVLPPQAAITLAYHATSG